MIGRDIVVELAVLVKDGCSSEVFHKELEPMVIESCINDGLLLGLKGVP